MSGIRGESFFSEAFHKQRRISHIFSIRIGEFLNKEDVDKIAKKTLQISYKREIAKAQASSGKRKRIRIGKLPLDPKKIYSSTQKIFQSH